MFRLVINGKDKPKNTLKSYCYSKMAAMENLKTINFTFLECAEIVTVLK